MQPYINIDWVNARKNSRFILLERLYFHMFYNLSIAAYAFPTQKWTSLSVDAIWIPKYEKLSTNFRILSVNVEFYLSQHRDQSQVTYVYLSTRDSA